jgi:hypothetical protein
MALDPRFIVTSDLEEYFVDKDSGAPLAAGIVTFYSDIDRTIKKPVYQITGSPPNYSYSALPNPCELSAVGTFQDADGNNIVPYYFPYEGTPSDSDGTVELYYITVHANDGTGGEGVLQFTREAWPNFTSEDVPSQNEGFRNFIPNGQFLSHTDNPPVEVDATNNLDIQYIAQGGWSFRRTAGGASVFNNSFTRITSGISGLDDYPRYAFNFVCQSFNASDQVRDLAIQWEGINQFSSGDPTGSQNYTYFLAGESGDSNTYPFDVRLIRNYGTGGSPDPQSDTSIGTILIGPTYSTKTLSISGIAPATGNLGTNNDDYIAIALRGPAASFNVQVTDFAMLTGDVQPQYFPVQTDADMKARGVAGWMPIPAPDGSDLYLPLVLTPKGMIFDHSSIGAIEALTDANDFTGSVSTEGNTLLADGSAYPTAGYSDLGIPYSRLQARVWNSTTNLPKFGTGQDFATAYIPTTASSNLFRIATNKDGSQSVTLNGGVSTGFAFSTIYMGNSAYEVNAYITEENNNIFVSGKNLGVVNDATAGTSGFTVYQFRNSPSTQQLFSVVVTALPALSTYFTFSKTTTDNFYVWFSIDGAGVDPAPGGTGILVPLLSTYTPANAAGLIREAISGFQGSNIQTIAAAAMTAGAYFTFHASGSTYVVWYKINGAGTPPAIAGTSIKVTLTGGETAAQVATATQRAINFYQFAVPNLKGVILRGSNVGLDDIPGDLDFESRFSLVDIYPSSGIGTYQFDQNLQHSHDYDKTNNPAYLDEIVGGPVQIQQGVDDIAAEILYTSTPTAYEGGTQTVPFNFSVNYVIRY